jgi:hypothetical protein
MSELRVFKRDVQKVLRRDGQMVLLNCVLIDCLKDLERIGLREVKKFI